MSVASFQHKPGPFKQQNKQHKTGRHRSKGTIDAQNRGRSDVKQLAQGSNANRSLSRKQRRNQAKQMREQKRTGILADKRALGGDLSPPILTTVVCLDDPASSKCVAELLLNCDETSRQTSCERGIVFLAVPPLKTRFGIITPDVANMHEVFDALKVSDVILLVWPLNGQLSENAELLLSAIFAHGMVSTLNIVTGLSELSGKQKETARKNLTKLMKNWSFDEKYYGLDSTADGVTLLRQICSCKKKPLVIQQRRPHLLVESAAMTDVNGDTGTLLLTGTIRGPSLSVNSLVHLPCWGDFQLEQIDLVSDPHFLKNAKVVPNTVLEVADAKVRESLQSEVIPDPMDAEQTWPTEQEIDQAKLEAKKKVRKVPKGTSEYQAAWFPESDDSEGEETHSDGTAWSGDDDDGGIAPQLVDAAMKSGSDLSGEESDVEQGGKPGKMSVNFNSQVDTFEYDAEINVAEVEKFRLQRENEQFPDEIDTPLDQAARVRFQKYRGLKSFRTSPWHPKENLPYDYSRIFQFADYRRTKKRVLKKIEEATGAVSGWHVTLHVKQVPVEFMTSLDRLAPLVVYGLLPHEQRMTVMNLVVKRHKACRMPVKSKETLVFHVGFRKFEAAPVFSQHSTGDKHKFERFLPSDEVCVASVFAPVVHPPASVLMFRKDAKGGHHLVATGAVLDLNPDRVVLKRIVLSGHPFKIQKRLAVVRYMFFNREDIEWFKPIELRTKYGRRGHIKEPLGTHGHMKCMFDNQLNSQDTVMMNLYKRVFPKWSFNCRIELPRYQSEAASEMEKMITD